MLKGKNAIITGARSGMGLAILTLFAANHCNIWAIVHREDDEFKNKCQALSTANNVWIRLVYVDLDSSDDIKNGVKDIIKEKQNIDILVNSAGVVSQARLFTMTPMSEIRRVMNVNFFAPIEICQLVSRSMIRQKKGNIINISSVSAFGQDTAQLEYASSKSALICATKKMAQEFGPFGVRVNALAPGLTQTKMLDEFDQEKLQEMVNGLALRRVGQPEEIAQVCLFLASENSSFVTGETIVIDGGGRVS